MTKAKASIWLLAACCCWTTAHGDAFPRAAWLEKAKRSTPTLLHREVRPMRHVKIVRDPGAFQQWAAEPAGAIDALYGKPLRPGDSFVIDFGEHVVGRLSIRIGESDAPVDAPCRLAFTFAEVPLELGEPLDAYKGGLCRSWLQDETVNFDFAPMDYTLPRRYAFRYARISVVSCPAGKPTVERVWADAETSADERTLRPWAAPSPQAARLDRIARNTLRDCMQTVFEDGPKRDRRLWLGDLRLEALADYETYRNFDVVRRSLYLLAGTAKENGLVGTDCYEKPHPKKGSCRIYDYTALFPQTVLEYLAASGDRATAEDLWPLCKRQMELVLAQVGEDGLVRTDGDWWYFIDWDDKLDRHVPEQGVAIFGAKGQLALARALGHGEEAREMQRQIDRMTMAAREKLWDGKRGLFAGKGEAACSCLGQAWMVIADVPAAADARRCLKNALENPAARKPRTPYGWHYLVESLYVAGLRKEADAALLGYWGAMADKGADTFWEAFTPDDDRLSPYGDPVANSYCHAWSCAPAYFLRSAKYRALSE